MRGIAKHTHWNDMLIFRSYAFRRAGNRSEGGCFQISDHELKLFWRNWEPERVPYIGNGVFESDELRVQFSEMEDQWTNSKSRALIFSSVGKECAPQLRLWRQAANVDVVCVAYEDVDDLNIQYHRHGFKWPNFLWWLGQHDLEHIVQQYDYIWVVDDDILMQPEEINKLFDTLRRFPIDFSSPSFSHTSAGVWRYFDRQVPNTILRHTNFVECSATVIRSRVLLDPLVRACLRATNTGCFLDFCFSALGSCAIIDSAVCHHAERASAMDMQVPRAQHQDDSARFAFLPQPIWWWRNPKVLSLVSEP